MNLSRLEIALLEQLKQNRDCSMLFVLNELLPEIGVLDKQDFLIRFQSYGLVSITGRNGDSLETRHIRLTPDGVHVLMLEDDRRQNRTAEEEKTAADNLQYVKDRKKDRRNEWLVAIFSIVGAAVISFCIEHFDKIRIFLGKFFH